LGHGRGIHRICTGTRRRKIVIALLAVGLLLVGARVALPYAVENFVNRKLAGLDAYGGHVGDIEGTAAESEPLAAPVHDVKKNLSEIAGGEPEKEQKRDAPPKPRPGPAGKT
jgi:hypothetical protein